MRLYICNICGAIHQDHDRMKEHITHQPHNSPDSKWFKHMSIKENQGGKTR